MSWDVLGCPMATWDNLHLGLAGWCKVLGGSRDVLGCPMATWDNRMVYGSLRFLGCPELSHGNLDLGLAGWWGVPGMSWVVPWQLGTTGWCMVV